MCSGRQSGAAVASSVRRMYSTAVMVTAVEPRKARKVAACRAGARLSGCLAHWGPRSQPNSRPPSTQRGRPTWKRSTVRGTSAHSRSIAPGVRRQPRREGAGAGAATAGGAAARTLALQPPVGPVRGGLGGPADGAEHHAGQQAQRDVGEELGRRREGVQRGIQVRRRQQQGGGAAHGRDRTGCLGVRGGAVTRCRQAAVARCAGRGLGDSGGQGSASLGTTL
jgi:hypothetical protein